MNTKYFLDEIFHILNDNAVLKRYNNLLNVDLLLKINFRTRKDKFSWGIFFLYIKILNGHQITPTEITIAANLELLAFSAELLDDFFDGDSEHLDILDQKMLVFLSYDILLESQIVLCSLSENTDYLLSLQKTLIGQWYDVTSTLSSAIDEEFYHNFIIPKTECFFHLIIDIANPTHKKNWLLFSKKLATSLQIGNDISAMNNTSKSDLINLTPSLPLIMAFQNKSIKKKILALNQDSSYSKHDLSLLIIQSGSLEYCHYLYLKYRDDCSILLNHGMPYNHKLLKDFSAYLKLEVSNEKRKNS
ncbi:MAG: hypothetical protein ACRC6X_01845 [Culicoidibacterales bacterium]